MLTLRTAMAAAVLLLLAPTAAGATARQGAPIRLAGGDLLGTTGVQADELRHLSPKTLAGKGRAIPFEGSGVQVTTRDRGRSIVVIDPGAAEDRITLTTYAARTMRRTARRLVDVGELDVDDVVKLGDRRLGLVQGLGVDAEPGRLVVVDPVSGRVVRSTALDAQVEDTRLLGTSLGVLLRTAGGTLRLDRFDADGRLVTTVPLPVPPTPRGLGAEPEARLRYDDGRAVALYRPAPGQLTVAQLDLRSGAVDSRTLDRAAAGIGAEPSYEPATWAEVVRTTSTTVDLVLDTNDSDSVLVSVGADGSAARVRILPGGGVTVVDGKLLIQGTRLSLADAAGRPRWTVRTSNFDLAPSVALVGGQVLQRTDDSDAETAIRSVRTGKRLRTRAEPFSLPRQRTGAPLGGAESTSDTAYEAVPGELF